MPTKRTELEIAEYHYQLINNKACNIVISGTQEQYNKIQGKLEKAFDRVYQARQGHNKEQPLTQEQ